MEELLLISSVAFLKDYVRALSKAITPRMSAADRYRTIYVTFNQYSFQNPEMFYNLFFGKYSQRLPMVVRRYYDLFPNELEGHTVAVRGMLLEGNMYLRDIPIVDELVKEGAIKARNAAMVAAIVPRIQQTFLHEVYMYGDKINREEQHEKFMQTLDYILTTAK